MLTDTKHTQKSVISMIDIQRTDRREKVTEKVSDIITTANISD